MKVNFDLNKKRVFVIVLLLIVGISAAQHRIHDLTVNVDVSVNRTTTTSTNITLYNVSSTYPANNVTNGTFGIGYVTRGNYTFPFDLTINNNLSVTGNISANQLQGTNVTANILCSRIVGGSDSDFCADATGGGGSFTNVFVEAANVSAEGIFGANTSNTIGNYRFPRNLTIGDKLIADLSLGFNINISAASSGILNTGLLAANVTELGQTIELGTETNWNGVTGLTFGTNVTFNGLTGLTLSTNVTWNGITGLTFTDNITGQLPQSRISGIIIPASNVTNATFSSANGLLFTFPNNITIIGNLSIDRLVSGIVPQSQINGITIPLVNASWNGVTGLTFGTNITFNGLTGLTFTDNITGQLPQSRISGITIPATNITNATFPFGIFTFADNVTIIGNLSADNITITTAINCLSIVGGTDTDFCVDATAAGGDPVTSYPADNITNGTFGVRFVTNGNYTFPWHVTVDRNLTIGDKIIGDGSLLNRLNATALTSGEVNTGLLAANVTELGQNIEQSEITGISIPLQNVTIGESSANYNYTANQTYKVGSGNNQICIERAVGTQANYTKCWNNTHIIERIGLFIVPAT